MNSEITLLALKHSINSTLQELGETILQDNNVRDVLTTFFAEQDSRPELVSLIKSQSLMHEYLDLTLEEREEFESFRQKFSDYLIGENKELRSLTVKSEKNKAIIRKQKDFFQDIENNLFLRLILSLL